MIHIHNSTVFLYISNKNKKEKKENSIYSSTKNIKLKYVRSLQKTLQNIVDRNVRKHKLRCKILWSKDNIKQLSLQIEVEVQCNHTESRNRFFIFFYSWQDVSVIYMKMQRSRIARTHKSRHIDQQNRIESLEVNSQPGLLLSMGVTELDKN